MNLAEFEQYLLDKQEYVLGVADIVNQVSSPNRAAIQGHTINTNEQIDQLALITEALQRIDEGEYGFCLKCESPIAEQALKADPTVQWCAACFEA